MKRTMAARIAWISTMLVLGATLAPANAADPPPSLDAPDLAKGPYSAMRMTLKKTFLKINVADIELRFDKASQARFGDIARAGGDAAAATPKIAEVALRAGCAVVQMRFNRDIPFDQ